MGGIISWCTLNPLKGNILGMIVQLKSQRDELEEYRICLINRIEETESCIKDYVTHGNRNQALLCLRKKALLVDQLSRIDSYLYQVLQVISDTELAQVNVDVYKHLKLGSELLSKLSKCMQMDDIESMLAVWQTCRENMEDTTCALNEHSSVVDNEALLEELEQLCRGDAVDIAKNLQVAPSSCTPNSETVNISQPATTIPLAPVDHPPDEPKMVAPLNSC
ncbi:Snf7 family protein [Babesia bovis T2Bo]|uniref:Uncharacterized protein n=1 Tax=Babesia bovis TaxID=5865 RepID=A7AM29_BABBO|nr:Snf7 family protein [Babesia bovis T2Bo]EDO07613.1 Snf7 family protein [Babesia bovis T2Bo]BAN64703.1 hypothetical protein [Babesia bovis]|eukprot:XP_001611181.1 hypothetical protein [Babesia bovis T2Bo]